MREKVFYFLIGLSLLFYLSKPSIAQRENFSGIFIDGHCLENVKEPKWLKEVKTIEIKDPEGDTKIELKVNPDSALINIIPSGDFPLKVLVDNSPIEQLDIQLPNKIKKYKVGLEMEDKSRKEFVFLHIKLGDKLNITKTDVALIIPAVFKVILKLPFRWLFPKKCTINIFRDSD